MVVADQSRIADVVFVVEGTANLSPYVESLKQNYILPTLEHFNGGPPDDRDCGCDFNSTLYTLVVFMASDHVPEPATMCFTPTPSTHKFMCALDKVQFIGGGGDGHSHIAEGLSTSLQVFDDLRDSGVTTQKHCILVCNSNPYSNLPSWENSPYSGPTVDQLASVMNERQINFSILSPRKIPDLLKLYEKSGGDLQLAMTKSYAKDGRHLVLLKGYQLQERPISPLPLEPRSVNSTGSPAPTQNPSPTPVGLASLGSQPPSVSSVQTVTGQSSGGLVFPQQQQQQQQQQQAQQQQNQQGPQNAAQIGPMGQFPGQQQQSQLQGVPNQIPGMSMQQPIPNPQQQQGQQAQQGMMVAPIGPGMFKDRSPIWQGNIEFQEKGPPGANVANRVSHTISCTILAIVMNGEVEVSGANWPNTLCIQLVPKQLMAMANLFTSLKNNARHVVFHFGNETEKCQKLIKTMTNGFAGVIQIAHQIAQPNDIRIMLVWYTPDKRLFSGIIANDQEGFYNGFHQMYENHRKQQQAKQQKILGSSMGANPNAMGPRPPLGPGGVQGQAGGPGAEQQQQQPSQQQQHPGGPNQPQVSVGGMVHPSMSHSQASRLSILEQERQQNLALLEQRQRLQLQQQRQLQQLQQQVHQQSQQITPSGSNPQLRNLLQPQNQQLQMRQQPPMMMQQGQINRGQVPSNVVGQPEMGQIPQQPGQQQPPAWDDSSIHSVLDF